MAEVSAWKNLGWFGALFQWLFDVFPCFFGGVNCSFSCLHCNFVFLFTFFYFSPVKEILKSKLKINKRTNLKSKEIKKLQMNAPQSI